MKIILIGNVDFTKEMLKELVESGACVSGVVTCRNNGFNADYADLSGICESNDIPLHYTSDINSSETIQWMSGKAPDMMFCFGFSQLLKQEVLDLAPGGVIGYHPAELPKNRGRHPIIWALVLGLDKTASTFFFMDKTADSGDILDQKVVEISYEDNAGTLYGKLKSTATEQLRSFLPKLERGDYKCFSQKGQETNYWRKRTSQDGLIDFRMSSRAIYNLVRGLTKPYVGAHLVFQGEEIKIWEAEEVDESYSNYEHGTVLKVEGTSILVKCADKAILFTEHEFKEIPKVGEYIL